MKRFQIVVVSIMVFFLGLFGLAEALQVPLLTDPGPWLAGGGAAAALLGFGLLVSDVVLPVPSSLIMIANGSLFGTLVGTLLSLAGALGAGLFGFAIGRRGGPLLARLVPADERERAGALLRQWGGLAIVVTRPIPILAETVAVLAGTSPLGWGRMTAATLAGSLPAAFLYALTGATAARMDNIALIFGLVLLVSGLFWAAGRWGRRILVFPLLFPLVLSAPAPLAAAAQEPVTFYGTATVEERPVAAASAPVTVLDRQDLERLGAVTAADALRHVPGVTVEQAGGRGGLSVARIRGGDPNFTLVLIDGVPVNDDTYQVGGVFDLAGLPAAAIERIEVVRGPFSSFYGSTGLGGVVQIVTRRGGEERAAEAELTAGDAGLFGGRALLTGPGYAAGASWEEESGRVAEESFEQLHLHGHRSWGWGEPGAGRRLQLSGRATGWNADDYPEGSGGPVYGDGAPRVSEHEELGLALDFEAGGAERRQAFTAGFYRHQLDRGSPAIAPLVPPSSEESTFTRTRAGWTWSRGLEGLGGLGRDARLSLGAEVAHEEGRNHSVLLLPAPLGGAVAGDYSLSRTTPALSAELFATRGRLTVELGTRLDVPDSDLRNGRSRDPGPQLSPRLGLAWRLGEAAGVWRLRASAGRAFKLPSFFALASPPALGGNPDLEPETMTGGDLGIEWRSPRESGEAGIGIFKHRYKNLVDFDFDLFTHLNRGQVDAEGAEAWFAWRPSAGWNVLGDLTYQDTEDRATGETLRQRPRWSGGLRLDWRPRETLSFHLGARHVSERRDEQIPVPRLTEVPGATVAFLGGDWRLPVSGRAVDSLRLSVRIDNLFDRDHETHLGFPAPGRSVRAGLRAGF